MTYKRIISSQAWGAIAARETTEAFLMLLTLTPSEGQVIRLVNNTTDITSREAVFIHFPFSLDLPSDEQGQIAEARIVLDNVSRVLIDEIRNLPTPLTALLEVILASTPDVIEASFPDFTLRSITYNMVTIEGSLTLEDFLSEPYPKDILTANNYPAMY